MEWLPHLSGRFQQYLLRYPDLDFSIDISRMRISDDFFGTMRERVEKAFAAMHELEAGAIANPDEGRMVGHYWLREKFERRIWKNRGRNRTVARGGSEDVFHILRHLVASDPAIRVSGSDAIGSQRFSK